MAKESLYWHRPYKTVRAGGFEEGDVQWFTEGGKSGRPLVLCRARVGSHAFRPRA
jgi:hypothetical protein